MSPPVKLQLLPDAPDAEGEPRAGLLVPPQVGSTSKRPVLMVFATVAAAIAAKRVLEEVADARP